MTEVARETVREYLLKSLWERFEARGVNPQSVQDEFDLLREDVIDSLGLLEVITAIEEHFGISVDLADLDADGLTRVGTLSAYVAAQCRVQQE